MNGAAMSTLENATSGTELPGQMDTMQLPTVRIDEAQQTATTMRTPSRMMEMLQTKGTMLMVSHGLWFKMTQLPMVRSALRDRTCPLKILTMRFGRFDPLLFITTTQWLTVVQVDAVHGEAKMLLVKYNESTKEM